MLKFWKGVVAGSGAGVKDLPYNIGEPYSSAWGSSTHCRGTSKVRLLINFHEKPTRSVKTLMLLRKPSIFFNSFSTQAASLKWRNQIKQTQIVSEVSSVLLQRQNWVPLIQKLNLSHKLTPNLFVRILRRTENNPEISLKFFNWAKKNLGFKPDLKSQYQIIQILIISALQQTARPLLDTLIQSEPASVVLNSLIGECKHRDSQSLLCSFVLECYSGKGLVYEGLEAFRKIRVYNYLPSIHSCNELLDALQRKGEIKLAWCFFAAIVRYGISIDSFTWSLVARILCKQGKVENAVKLLNSGVYNAVIYNLIIEFYCKMGNLTAAIDLLNEMYSKNLTPGFSIYSSVLDGACRFGNVEVVEMITRDMVSKELLPGTSLSNYNPSIQKLCELGRTYAAEMFFERSLDEKIGLVDSSYRYLLRVFCKEGRVKEAMRIYQLIVERGITVNRNCYHSLADVICKEGPSEEVESLLKDVICKGFVPSGSDLAKFIASQCSQGRWKEAEGILNLILEKGFLPDCFCCCSLIDYYCGNRQIDLAVELHDKMEKLGGSLDSSTYSVLLTGLFKEKKIDEAIRVFDYMRRRNLVSSGCFSIMIVGLCHQRELRKAMKVHDEMLKMGLKPGKAAYKSLISKFL